MTRNQVFASVEFIDDLIKMSVGEYHNEKFYIFDNFKCKCNGLKSSDIIDEEEVKKTIRELVDLAQEKTEKIIQKVILCLPGEHLIISETSSTLPATGANHFISKYDINEAYKTAQKYRHQENELIIDIAATEYQLEDGEKKDSEPIRYKSETFKTLFNVYMLPVDVYNSYFNAIASCNLQIDGYYLDYDCLYAGIFEEDDISSSILNINKCSTSLLVYKKGKLLNKISLPYGTSEIEAELEKELYIKDYNDIKNMIYNVGSCEESDNKHLSVCQNGEGKFISEHQLNEIIRKNCKKIFENLIAKSDGIVDLNNMDICFTGYGANIKGIDRLFSEISGCNSYLYKSPIFGLNNISCCQTIGLIRLNYKKISQNKYMNLQNNNYNDIISDKEKNSKFDKFILDEDDLD